MTVTVVCSFESFLILNVSVIYLYILVLEVCACS